MKFSLCDSEDLIEENYNNYIVIKRRGPQYFSFYQTSDVTPCHPRAIFVYGRYPTVISFLQYRSIFQSSSIFQDTCAYAQEKWNKCAWASSFSVGNMSLNRKHFYSLYLPSRKNQEAPDGNRSLSGWVSNGRNYHKLNCACLNLILGYLKRGSNLSPIHNKLQVFCHF